MLENREELLTEEGDRPAKKTRPIISYLSLRVPEKTDHPADGEKEGTRFDVFRSKKCILVFNGCTEKGNVYKEDGKQKRSPPKEGRRKEKDGPNQRSS